VIDTGNCHENPQLVEDTNYHVNALVENYEIVTLLLFENGVYLPDTLINEL